MYAKDGSKPFRTGINNVGLQSHFYSVVDENGVRDSRTTEEFLAEKVEQPANPVIKKIRRRARMTAEDKRKLAVYMVGMSTRVPKSREQVRRDVPRRMQAARETTWETLHKLASDSQEDQQRLEHLLKETQEAFIRIEKDLIKELSLPFFDEEVIATVCSMAWTRFAGHRRSSLVTSDNPFCYTESEGLLSDSSFFVFPVCSDAVLIGSWAPAGYPDYAIGHTRLGQDDTDAINRIVISSAAKYIYHCARSKWVSDMIKYTMERQASGIGGQGSAGGQE